MIITVAAGATNTGYTGTQQPIVQNLGPGDLYLGTVSTDLTTEGLKLPAGSVYELPKVVQEGAGAIWIQAVGSSCDVRIVNVG